MSWTVPCHLLLLPPPPPVFTAVWMRCCCPSDHNQRDDGTVPVHQPGLRSGSHFWHLCVPWSLRYCYYYSVQCWWSYFLPWRRQLFPPKPLLSNTFSNPSRPQHEAQTQVVVASCPQAPTWTLLCPWACVSWADIRGSSCRSTPSSSWLEPFWLQPQSICSITVSDIEISWQNRPQRWCWILVLCFVYCCCCCSDDEACRCHPCLQWRSTHRVRSQRHGSHICHIPSWLPQPVGRLLGPGIGS